VRPSPCPIALSPREEPKADLLAFKQQLCDRPLDPTLIRCSVHAQSEDDVARIQLGYGPRTVGIPIIGSWPLDDLGPMGLVELVREIVAGMVEDHAGSVQDHAAIALAICGMTGDLPEGIIQDAEGRTRIEVCLDDDAKPIFWIENDIGFHRLRIDLATLVSFAGRMPIPCHMYGIEQSGRSFDTIGFSMNEEEGIVVHVAPLDAMRMLRLQRHVDEALEEARLIALGDEA
jgi:hypothetical protein